MSLNLKWADRHMKNFILLAMAMLLFAIPAAAQENDRDRGIALYRAGNYTDAVAALRRAVEVDKRDGPAWRYLGAALVNLGDDEEALKAFSQGNLNPATFSAERQKYDPYLKVLNKRPAAYTAEARRLGIEGEVMVIVELRADGKVGFVFPKTTLPAGLTENVIEAARGIRFTPAVQNGVPVTTIQLLAYNFSIK